MKSHISPTAALLFLVAALLCLQLASEIDSVQQKLTICQEIDK